MSRFASSPRLRSALFGLLPAILLAVGSPQAREAIAYLVPFLALLAALLAGRYPGERLIGKRSRPAAPRRCRPSPALRASFAEPRARRAPLLAFAEAGRAPPSSLWLSNLCRF
jgi:hypothetical protein